MAEEALSAPLLVVAPHPDDESLGCGGLLADCWRRGQRAHVVCLTDGTGSHPNSRAWPAPKLADRRWRELRAAVGALGGAPGRDVTWLGYPDTALERLHRAGPELAEDILATARRVRARTLVAPSPHDPHGDHVAAAGAVQEAMGDLPGRRLYYYPVWSRWRARDGEAPRAGPRRLRRFFPERRAAKAAAIAAHASQTPGWVPDDPKGFTFPPGFSDFFVKRPEVFDSDLRDWDVPEDGVPYAAAGPGGPA
jgi:LmbE family N-acetylglucosaminyl deacetylase